VSWRRGTARAPVDSPWRLALAALDRPGLLAAVRSRSIAGPNGAFRRPDGRVLGSGPRRRGTSSRCRTTTGRGLGRESDEAGAGGPGAGDDRLPRPG